MPLHRLLRSPLALHSGSVPVILDMASNPVALGETMDSGQSDRRPYDVVSGVAVIPISGILVHERTWWSWDEMSYAEITEMFLGAMHDPEVRSIALHINSPGGEVCGCFDLADTMFSMRGVKPTTAIVNEAAYSAAYALASTADGIVVPRTGGVGSIGVISMHVDITGMLDKAGIKVTTVQYGDRKSDSQPTTPLSEKAEEEMQRDVDMMGEMFVALVARNRGMSPDAVRATQAGCFLGDAGVEAGLADYVMSADQALMTLIEHASTSHISALDNGASQTLIEVAWSSRDVGL
jgi:capsid assembly protease